MYQPEEAFEWRNKKFESSSTSSTSGRQQATFYRPENLKKTLEWKGGLINLVLKI